MSNQTKKGLSSSQEPAPALIPFQVKAKPDIRKKIEEIALLRGLSKNDVASMCLSAGLQIVERKLGEIHDPIPQAA